MHKNLGMNFNIAVVFDEDSNVSMGMNYNDSQGIEISTQVDGDNVVEVLDALMTAFVEDYMACSATSEEKPLSELDMLKAEVQRLQEENARLEHRLQEQFPKKKTIKEEASKEDIEEALKYVDDLVELFNMLYK